MTITHSVTISGTAEDVFAVYKEFGDWPSWDTETQSVSLADGLTSGSVGWLKPRKGPKARVRVAEVTDNKSFTMEGVLPFCRIHFKHVLSETNGTTQATHSVQFTGPLRALFRRVIGRDIDASLPATLQGLKGVVERGRLA